MAYQQLTQDQRFQIYTFLIAGFSQPPIARQLGVDRSTISRELRRNRGQRGYRPKHAQHLTDSRRKAKENATRISAASWQQVEADLRKDRSPEQVSGALKAAGQLAPRNERIYLYIYADMQQRGELFNHLRCQKMRRKR